MLSWNNATWDSKSKLITSGENIVIDYVGASAILPFTDIKSGDEIFIVSVKDGELHIGGRIIAEGEPVTKDVALKRLGANREYNWERYIIGKPDSIDSFKPSNKLSLEDVRQLQLVDVNGVVTNPTIKEGNRIEHQHFRNPRRISIQSASVLRAALGIDISESVVDGLSTDISALINDKSIDETTRKQLIAARIGQGQFRKNVIAVWGKGEQCAVTGVSLRDVLVASHIKPWKSASNEERLAGWNGLMLVSILDKLFDRFLISFSDSGKIVSSRRLLSKDWQELKSLGISMNMGLNFSHVGFIDEDNIKNMLREHRDILAIRDGAASL
jgi:hypothetical protein